MILGNVDHTQQIKLFEVNTSSVSSQILMPFCVSWSNDNKISIVAEGGVYIFELWPIPSPDRPCVSYTKSWIPVSSSLPLNRIIPKDKQILWSLKKNDAYETVFDTTLSQAVQKSDNLANSQVIQCEFTPLIGNTSYITCLTNNGCLEIYKNHFRKWFPVVNVSELWINHNNPNIDENVDFNKFKRTMLKLKITAFKWADKPSLILATSHANGCVTIWETTISKRQLSMNIKYSFQTIEKPCCLELIPTPNSKYVAVIIGTLCGKVKLYSFDFSTGELKENLDLWTYEDLILVSLIKAKYLDSKLVIFEVKQYILMVQILTYNDQNEFKVSNSEWLEFSNNISGFSEYFENDFIISLYNHELFLLKINEKPKEEVFLIDMNIKQKNKSFCHCFGFALSQNKAIWVLVSSPKVSYDSLKEITNLLFYSTETLNFKGLTDSSAVGLIEKISREFPTIQLFEILDLLELKKFELLNNNSKFKENFEMTNSSPLGLKLMLWEIKLKMLCNSDESNDTLMNLEYLIAKNRAKEIVKKLESLDTLNELQKSSCNISNFLLLFDRKDLETKGNSTSCGTCVVCGSETYFENVRISSCVNSHLFPRCCLSFLPCNEVSYASCKNCDSVALLEFLESDSLCLYCDGILVEELKV